MKFLRFLLVIAIAIFSACSDDSNNVDPILVEDDCIEGTGAIESETRSLGDFTAIRSAVPANIFVTQGPLEDVRIEAPSNFLPILRTTVADNTLSISLDECIENLGNVDIFVTIPVVNTLALSGIGSFSTLKDIDTEELNIEVTGIGDFNLQGRATSLNIDIEGTGEINAFDLISPINSSAAFCGSSTRS